MKLEAVFDWCFNVAACLSVALCTSLFTEWDLPKTMAFWGVLMGGMGMMRGMKR